MLVLVGCEESQEVCKAFRELGHEAYSCDFKDCSGGHPEWHLKMDVLEAIKLKNWDMFILFPDCTYITVSGLHWNKRVPNRAQKTEEALQFVCTAYNSAVDCGIKKIVFENPVGCISTRISKDSTGHLIVMPVGTAHKGHKPSQIIQPYNFNEDASKATCLWLYNTPPLQSTCQFPPRITKMVKSAGATKQILAKIN